MSTAITSPSLPSRPSLITTSPRFPLSVCFLSCEYHSVAHGVHRLPTRRATCTVERILVSLVASRHSSDGESVVNIVTEKHQESFASSLRSPLLIYYPCFRPWPRFASVYYYASTSRKWKGGRGLSSWLDTFRTSLMRRTCSIRQPLYLQFQLVIMVRFFDQVDVISTFQVNASACKMTLLIQALWNTFVFVTLTFRSISLLRSSCSSHSFHVFFFVRRTILRGKWLSCSPPTLVPSSHFKYHFYMHWGVWPIKGVILPHDFLDRCTNGIDGQQTLC